MQNHRLAPKSKRRREYDDGKLGMLGAASACRRIDPETGEVIEILAPKGRCSKKSKSNGPKPVKAKRRKARKVQGTLADAANRIVEEEARRSPLLRTIR